MKHEKFRRLAFVSVSHIIMTPPTINAIAMNARLNTAPSPAHGINIPRPPAAAFPTPLSPAPSSAVTAVGVSINFATPSVTVTSTYVICVLASVVVAAASPSPEMSECAVQAALLACGVLIVAP